MKIYILTMDDPIKTNDFIKSIVDSKKDDIVGLAVTKGNRLTISKKKSKLLYLFSLLLIMGPINFTKNIIITLVHKFKILLSKINLLTDPTLIGYANKNNIESRYVSNPNDEKFIEYLKKINPDLIINQSQCIIKKEILSIPKKGVINRHNAILPRNRGRLTPFWVLFNGDKETGVSIHFLNEKIDDGDIIVQKTFNIQETDDFNSVVTKNYKIAKLAIIEALEIIENGKVSAQKNDKRKSTYNTIPSVRQAWIFRKRIINKFI